MTTETTARCAVDVTAPAGLHARPAAAIAAAAARFRSDIQLHNDGREADAKSVLLLLTLDVREGAHVVITAQGPDADEAVAALAKLVETP